MIFVCSACACVRACMCACMHVCMYVLSICVLFIMRPVFPSVRLLFLRSSILRVNGRHKTSQTMSDNEVAPFDVYAYFPSPSITRCQGPAEEQAVCQGLTCDNPVRLTGATFGEGQVEVFNPETGDFKAVCGKAFDKTVSTSHYGSKQKRIGR